MKRIGLILALLISLAGCATPWETPPDIHSIQSYRDIPGVTQREQDAIEALKAKYGGFSYGHLITTESFRQADGSYAGFTIELCALLSGLFQTEFSPLAYEEWVDLKRDIDNRKLNFSGEFTQTTARTRFYEMTKPIAGRGLSVYYLKSAPEIKSEADMAGMRVGFLRNTAAIDLVAELYPDNGFTSVEVASFSDTIRMLLSGELDAFVTTGVSDTMFEDYDFIRSKEIFQFVYAPVSITTNDSELAPLISVINKYLDAGGMDLLFDLYRDGSHAYKKHRLNLSFTDEERAYLEALTQQNASVNVALQHDAYPASFYNTVEGRYDGAAYDILTEVSELTGIVFNSDCMPVEKALSDILAKLKSGEISMMPQLLYSESRKDDYIWGRISYITTNYALLSKSEFPTLQPFQVYYATVGTIHKSAHEEVFSALFPGHENTKVYQTGDEGFDALERGEIDLLMLAETMLLVQTNYREKLGYKVNITFSKTLDTLFGYNKDETILRDIIDKAMVYIDVEGIEEDWLSRLFDYQRKMLRDMTPYIILTVALLLTAFLTVFIFYIKNRRISKHLEETVRERTHELERQTTTLTTIYKAIPDLLFCKDLNSVYTSCNPSYESYTGQSEAEIVGKNDFQLFHLDPSLAELYIEADRKALNNQELGAIEEVIPDFEGTRRIFETFKTPLVQNGEVIGMMGISRDITERKAAEAALEKRLEQQRLMATLSQSFIATRNVEKQISESLRQIGEFMGISRVLLMKLDGNSLHCLYGWDNPAQNLRSKLGTVLPLADDERSILAALSQRKTTYFSLDDIGREKLTARHQADDVKNFIMLPIFVGDEIWGSLDFTQCDTYTPWTASDINLGEMVAGILSGVMNRQSVEDKLIEAKELAEQNSKAKSDFLSRMSHEMRTPMNAIIGMTSIAKSADDIQRKDYCLSKIDSASTHLLGVINDVLDLSKIEAGKFELSNTEFSLEKTLIKLTNVFNFRIEEKGQSFTVKLDPNIPPLILSDEQRLSQIITNLIGNAVKFTPDNGAISLSVRILAQENDLYTLQFEVTDTGIGISEAQQRKLFTSFEQGDGSVSRKYGGTGLGLAISKHIIEMMGGRIWVESRAGEGSSFLFTILVREGHRLPTSPRTEPGPRDLHILTAEDDEGISQIKAEEGAKHGESASFAGTRILLAEDVDINREIVLALLEPTGIQIDCAEDGQRAYQMFRNNPDYDMIFMDIHMPEVDGYTATRRIRALPDPRAKEVPIIAMTANVFREDIERCLDAGMNAHIGKPIDIDDVIAKLREYLPTQHSEG